MLIVPVATCVFPGTEKKMKFAHSKTHALKSLIDNSRSARGQTFGPQFGLVPGRSIHPTGALQSPETAGAAIKSLPISTPCFFLPETTVLYQFAYSLGRAHALYSHSPEHKMSSYKISPAETILVDLVHDLRQYLGNIETSVYCLELQNESTHMRSRGYLRTIQQQLAHADSRLSDAGAALTRLRTQRRDGDEILALTNSATSAVT
jgi:hypothetical protein